MSAGAFDGFGGLAANTAAFTGFFAGQRTLSQDRARAEQQGFENLFRLNQAQRAQQTDERNFRLRQSQFAEQTRQFDTSLSQQQDVQERLKAQFQSSLELDQSRESRITSQFGQTFRLSGARFAMESFLKGKELEIRGLQKARGAGGGGGLRPFTTSDISRLSSIESKIADDQRRISQKIQDPTAFGANIGSLRTDVANVKAQQQLRNNLLRRAGGIPGRTTALGDVTGRLLRSPEIQSQIEDPGGPSFISDIEQGVASIGGGIADFIGGPTETADLTTSRDPSFERSRGIERSLQAFPTPLQPRNILNPLSFGLIESTPQASRRREFDRQSSRELQELQFLDADGLLEDVPTFIPGSSQLNPIQPRSKQRLNQLERRKAQFIEGRGPDIDQLIASDESNARRIQEQEQRQQQIAIQQLLNQQILQRRQQSAQANSRAQLQRQTQLGIQNILQGIPQQQEQILQSVDARVIQ